MKYCDACGHKLEKVEIPRTSSSYEQFDEDSGKLIIDKYKLCFNKGCKDGKEHICQYLQGGHIRPIEHDIILIFAGLSVILPFIFVPFTQNQLLALPLLILMICLIPFGIIWNIRDCGRCGYKQEDCYY